MKIALDYTCPVCEGILRDAVAQRVVTHADHHAIFDAEYLECENCGEGFVSPAQADRNDAKMREAKCTPQRSNSRG